MGLYKMIENKKKEQKRKKKAKTIKVVGITAAVGVTVGAVTGILCAPKSGKEIRGDLADKTSKAKEGAVKKSSLFKGSLSDKVEEGKKDIVTAREKISEYLASKKKQNKSRKSDVSEEIVISDESKVEATDDMKIEE